MDVRERYSVPLGVEIATQWAWRLLLLAGAAVGGIWLVRFFSEITVPLAVALLGTALTVGAVNWLDDHGIPRVLATFAVVVAMLVTFFGALTLVGQQMSTQLNDLRTNVVQGISQIQDWAKEGPLGLSDSQVTEWVDRAKAAISTGDTSVISQATQVGTTLTHFIAGFFIALFAAFFFLFEGERMWRWVVAIFPRSARAHVDSSGRVAWTSLTSFVRATVLVALVDALGIAVSAWILGVPLAFAIGVLVFLGAFVPIVGALASGLVAVLVALVAQGPWTALFMLIAVIVVQQVESHVLQPFLMGRFVSVHPLAIILAIAAGITLGGIVGALIAVPFVACVNSVVKHLVQQHDGLAEESTDFPPGAPG
jgi:predicted PurR-regulated permease PerM